MKYKVIKKFYDPFKKRRVLPGEVIEIPEEYLNGYKAYVTKIETAKQDPKKETAKIEPKKKSRRLNA